MQKFTTRVLPYIVLSLLCFLGFFTPTDIHGQSNTYLSRCTSLTTRIINDLNGHDFNDPLYGCQWYMRNRGLPVSEGGTDGEDINVEEVWLAGTEGDGVNVVVIDGGMDFQHEDLADNVNTALNHSYTSGSIFNVINSHGTTVAGMIAAVGGNRIGIRGVAPQATIYGYNLLVDNNAANRADAMARNLSVTGVSNNSWGAPDTPNLHPVESTWEMAVDRGVTEGFDGKGIFYSWAAGNGDDIEDQANFEEYSNYYAITSVCSVDNNGLRSVFSEVGVNLWVCAPGEDVGSTVNSNGYDGEQSGTSFAAPLVSGVAALVRETNSELTWRDIKLILAASARKNDESDPGWEMGALKYGSNSERYNYNSKYGFGVVDAEEAVGLAESWSIVPSMRTLTVSSGDINQDIPDQGSTEHALTLPESNFFIEFVEINVNFTHSYFGDLSIDLVAPTGTVSELVEIQQVSPILYIFAGIPVPSYNNYTHRFGSAKHLGENPSGRWTLRINDNVAQDEGELHSWNIKVYGHDFSPQPTFGTEEIADQLYIQDSAISSLTLPPAANGDRPLTYSLSPLPDGLVFDSETRVLSGIPTATGSTVLTYTVRDANGDMDTLTFRIEVESDTSPTFGTQMINDQQYMQRIEISPLTLPVATGGNGQLTYSLTGQPRGLRLENGQLVGIPTEVVTGSTVTYTVQDEDGDTAMFTFTAAVVGTAVCDSGATIVATLSLDETVTGNVGVHGGLDRFQIDAAADINVEIVAEFTNKPNLINDIVLQLCDGSHNIIDSEISHSSEGQTDLTIEFRLKPGTYYIDVGLLLPHPVPSPQPIQYELQVSQDADYNSFLSLCERLTMRNADEFDGHDFDDPLYGCQWYMRNTGVVNIRTADGEIIEGIAGEDINVEDVWLGGTTGSGINVAVVDTGMDFRHEDLAANVNTALNHSYVGGSIFNRESSHGTAVAGVIASVGGNAAGIRGVAPQATIYGYNLLENSTVANKADAMTRNLSETAVSNNSWNVVTQDPRPHGAPTAWQMAVERGVTEGFGGKGIFYSWSAGNGHTSGDQANYDGYINHYAITAVCAVDIQGNRSPTSEVGVNLWVCAPGKNITSALNNDRYSGQLSGTSLSAPLVSGVAALVRGTNSDLSWRDVKLILAASARKNDESDPGWEMGTLKYGSHSERYNYNLKYGFGVVDAEKAVGLAESWSIVPSIRTLEVSSGDVDQEVPDQGITELTLDVPSTNFFTEFVEIGVRFTNLVLSDMDIDLVSPGGTVSRLSLSQRYLSQPSVFDSSPAVVSSDSSTYSNYFHRFGSARHLGEDPSGEWTLRISPATAAGRNDAVLHSWSIKVYGHGVPSEPTFGTETIQDQQYAQNSAITPLTLPVAIHGNKPLTYSLVPLPDGLVFDTGTRVLSGIPTALGSTDLTYTVRDADGDEDDLTFTITVVPDQTPTFGTNTVEDQRYVQNSAITPLTLPEASGGNGNLIYGIAPLPDGLVFDNGTRVLSGTPAVAGSTDVIYTARDADRDEVTLMFTINVIADTPPTFGTQMVADQNYINGFAITPLNLPEASGGTPPLRYSFTDLPAGLRLENGQLVGTPTEVVTGRVVTYTVQDAGMIEATLTFTVNIAADVQPTFGTQTIDNQRYVQNSAITPLDLPDATGGNAPLEYSLTGLPAGLRLENGQLVGTPSEAVTDQTATYTVRDADGDEATLTFMITAVADEMPTFATDTIDDQQYIQRVAISPLTLPVATGGDGQLTYSLTGLPAGLRLENGQLVGVPTRTVSDAGITYTVQDQDGDTATLTFAITVAPATVCDSDGTVLATLNLDETVTGSIGVYGGMDHFQIDLATDTNLKIVAQFTVPSPLANDIVLQLCNSSHELIASEISSAVVVSDNELTIEFGFRPGTYYIGVGYLISGRIPSPQPIQYEFQVSEDADYNAFISLCESLTMRGINEFAGHDFNDPLYGCQWHLKNRGIPASQGGAAGEDINVEDVWLGGTEGSGVNVAVVDRGMDFRHADLAGNVNTALNHSYTDGSIFNSENAHGTAVAGMIASVGGNGIGIRGAAPQATIYGYNFLDNPDSANEADAMTRNLSVTAVSNNSWGEPDVPALHSAPSSWEMAVERGITEGFGNKGIFYSWAAGNGSEVGDQANFEEYNNYYAVTSVCSVDNSGVRSSSSETGVNLWVCAPGENVTSTINNGRYNGEQSGTSFAAPLVSGVAALVRETNSELTWRDIKLILAASARKNDESDSGWEMGALKYGSHSERYNYNSRYGFGVVDAEEAVGLAESWSIVPSIRTLTVSSGDVNQSIPDLRSTELTLNIPNADFFTEFVEIGINFSHTFFADLGMELISPTGTRAQLVEFQRGNAFFFLSLGQLRYDDYSHRFGSAKHLGENPSGEWTLRISDNIGLDTGTLHSWSIKVYGHDLPPEPTFGTETIQDQLYAQDSAITPLTLPVAIHGNNPLTYSLGPLPDGLVFDSGTRVLSGMPTTLDSMDLTYTVQDADGDEDALTFRITVVPDMMPTFGTSTIEDQQYMQNSAITPLTLPEASGGNNPLTYSLDPLPDGLVFDSGTRVLSGMPTTQGSTDLTYTVRDMDRDKVTLVFTINVFTVCGSDSTVPPTLSLDETVTGSIGVDGGMDYFQIDLATDVNLGIVAQFTDTPPLENYMVLQLCDSSHELIFSEMSGAVADENNELTLDFNLRAGTYYIGAGFLIPGAEPSPQPIQYEFQVSEDTDYNAFVSLCESLTMRGINEFAGHDFNDPLYGCQWHLKNRGIPASQGGTAGEDINVEDIWLGGTTGRGVNVAVVDDGMDIRHADLAGNINTALNHNYTGNTIIFNPESSHGTAVAGMIASVGGNGTGIRGAAPQATIYGYNLLDNPDSANEADAMSRNLFVTAVSNNSWGSPDVPALHSASSSWEMAVEEGITEGFGGKGIFYSWVAGNGDVLGDQANFEEYNNYYAVTSVCSVDNNGVQSSFSEKGVNLWVCAPGEDVTSTINNDRYNGEQNGTSFAAPLVSGVAALLRETNSELSWRDIKLILAASARKNDESDPGWEMGALKYGSHSERYNYNSRYGFGVVDAEEAVGLAESWRTVPSMRTLTVSSGDKDHDIPDRGSTELTLNIPNADFFTEFVEIGINFTHTYFADLGMELISPTGTRAQLVEYERGNSELFFRFGQLRYGGHSHRFGSAKHLGEDPSGQWTLRISDNLADDTGTLHSWSIKIYGHDLPSEPTFGTETIQDQQYAQNAAITPLTLPVAIHGNKPLTYSLVPLPDGLVFDTGTRVLSGMPTTLGSTDLTYTVQDADGDQDALMFTITVVPDTMPTFGTNSVEDQQYVQNSAIPPLDLPVATSGNEPLTYSLTGLPAGLRLESGQLVGTPSELVTGRTVTYTVRDADGDEITLTFTINVAADTQPTFGAQTISDQSYVTGIAIPPLDLPVVTGGNAPLGYSLTGLPAGLRLESGQLVGTPAEVVSGQRATYTARDANGDTAALTFTITVAENTAPDFGSAAIDDQSYIEGIAITTLTLPQAEAGGNGDLTYSITPLSPFGLTFDPSTRELRGTPTSTGMEIITYKVVDEDRDVTATDEDMLTFTVTVAANTAPDFGSEAINDQSYVEGIAIPTFTLPQAETGGNGDLTYSITPSSLFGLTFDPSTRELSGMPSGTGTETVMYKVVDADEDMTATDEDIITFTIEVAEDTEPNFDGQMIGNLQYVPNLAITPVPLPAASSGNGPLTYSLPSRPDGFDFNAETRVLSGTPTTLGSTTMTYSVRDVDGDETTLTFTIEVVEDAVPGFAGQTIADQQYVQDVAITTLELPEATGGNAPLTYSLVPLPDGIVFNRGTRELSGSPATLGSTSLTYTARDADGDVATLTFMITVAANAAPDFGSESIADQSYTEGTAIRTLTLPEAETDGNGDSTYSIAPASPFGLTFNPATRELSGTPASAGMNTITYKVVDADGDMTAADEDTITFTITVAENTPPDFGSEAVADQNYVEGATITPLTLPQAAVGGNGDLTYSIDPATPFGLTFDPANRRLSGTPAGTGNQMIIYKVVDGDDDMTTIDEDMLTFTITVAADERPTFSIERVEDQQYVQNSLIRPLILPEVTGGNRPFEYIVRGLPAGLRLENGRLVGTPTETVTRTTVIYTVRDADGDEVTLTFDIEVEPRPPSNPGSAPGDNAGGGGGGCTVSGQSSDFSGLPGAAACLILIPLSLAVRRFQRRTSPVVFSRR